MKRIESVEQLEALYGDAIPGALKKVRATITPLYEKWIGASRFVVLATVGECGTDASPRGDIGPGAKVRDEKTLLIPDWRGNNRLDSLRNIVEDGRVSLMFMVPGSNNVVRVNGNALLTDDSAFTQQFNQGGKVPKSVIVVDVVDVYFQCAKALMRSRLWQSGDCSAQIPTAGEFIKELDSEFDAQGYDAGYEEYAKDRMW